MATSSHLREINQRQLLAAPVKHRRASRAELAKIANMSKPTVGRIVDELVNDHVLVELPGDAPDRPMMGRPSQFLELDKERQRFLAIQLGVKNTRMATLPIAIPSSDDWSVTVPTPKSATSWVKTIAKGIAKMNTTHLEAVLISVPGVVDEDEGRILLSPNLRWSEGESLKSLCDGIQLPGATPPPVIVIQEIRALALGQLAVDPVFEDFLLVDFGDGVGAAAVVNGSLYRGALALSGELGHTPVLGNKRPCGCGAIGCVETLVSRGGLLESAAHANGSPIHWPQLLSELADGDPPSWLKHGLDAVAVTIVGALNVMGLRRVVITGTITELPASAQSHLFNAIKHNAMWSRFGEVVCSAGPRHRTAGLVSAAIERFPVRVGTEASV